jgi:cytochrome c553
MNAAPVASSRGSVVIPFSIKVAHVVRALAGAAMVAAAFAAVGALLMLTLPVHAATPFTVPDTLEQRVAACVTCHGKEGRATNDGYFPRIAGKPAGYLYNQLVNFREGRRNYAPMTHLVQYLSDDYLREIAEYFSKLDLPYPAPQTVGASPELLSRGQTLVRQGDTARGIPACAACHGEALTGVAPAIPGLLGLPRDYLNGQLGAWRAGARHAHAPDCMATVAGKLAPEDIGAVSTWLSSQPLVNAHPASSLPAALPIDCGGVPK